MRNLFLFGALLLLPITLSSQELIVVESNFLNPAIYKFSFSDSTIDTLPLVAGVLPQAICVNEKNGGLYWVGSHFETAEVYASNVDLIAPSPLPPTKSVLRGVVVDPNTNMIYWASSNLQTGSVIGRTEATSIDSDDSLVIYNPGSLNAPREIAINPSTRLLYWADYNSGAIFSASMDTASSPEALVTGLQGPVGLAIDTVAEFIYWTEFMKGSIGVARLDGSEAKELIGGLGNPNHLSVDPENSKIYWTELDRPGVWVADQDGSNVSRLPIPVQTPMGLTVLKAGVVDRKPTPNIPKGHEVKAIWNGQKILKISFRLPEVSTVSVEIFNMEGKKSKSLSKQIKVIYPAGESSQSINMQHTPSGLYMVVLKANSIQRLVQIKVP